MARKEVRHVGSGITQHRQTRIVFDGPGEPGEEEKLFELLDAAAQRNAPWAWLERERKIAERTLAKISEGETGTDGERIFEPHHGSGWYSREILKRIGWIERARDKGDIEWACRSSAELAELVTTIRIKRAWDKDVETGMKVSRPGEESRKGRTAEQRNMAIRELRRDGIKVGIAIATVAAEDGVTIKAVEKQYYKKRPTPVSRK